jgi:hypothetical protein
MWSAVLSQDKGNGIEYLLLLLILASQTSCQRLLPMDASPTANRGAKGVCEVLSDVEARTDEGLRDGDYTCRTTTAGGNISLTATSSSLSPNLLEEVLLEGRYKDMKSGEITKSEMTAVAGALFGRLNMYVPPGMAVAIQNRSHSVVAAGRMRLSVDHLCSYAETDCHITIRIQTGITEPAYR